MTIVTRKALLAQIHIAKKDLDICDDDYRDILKNEFGVASSASLNMHGLRRLVARFRESGWQTARPQAKALQEKIKDMAQSIENGEKRLKGLCRKLCRTDRLEWIKDVDKLKSLLAALTRIGGNQ